MNSVVNRRVFVGTVAAGLPLLVTGGAATAAQRGSARTVDIGADALERELVRQIRENVGGMRGLRRGESARRLAATLRFAAADFARQGVDARVKNLLEAAVRQDGEEAFLLRQVDPAAELRAFGITRVPVQVADYAARKRAVREILANGVTPTILAIADQFDGVSRDFDNYPLVPVKGGASCPDLQWQLVFIEVAMIGACLANAVTCAVFSGMYAGTIIALAIYGC